MNGRQGETTLGCTHFSFPLKIAKKPQYHPNMALFLPQTPAIMAFLQHSRPKESIFPRLLNEKKAPFMKKPILSKENSSKLMEKVTLPEGNFVARSTKDLPEEQDKLQDKKNAARDIKGLLICLVEAMNEAHSLGLLVSFSIPKHPTTNKYHLLSLDVTETHSFL